MTDNPEIYHVPVMLNESVDGLLCGEGTYVDVTFGGGGHSREILKRLSPDSRLYGFDQDKDAEQNIVEDKRFVFVRSNFRYLKNWMRYYGEDKLSGVIADLGVSSHHFDDEKRGFSFRYDAPLDMRMNNRSGLTAADILQEYDEERLGKMFALYGEIKDATHVATRVVRYRKEHEIKTTSQLIEAVWGTKELTPGMKKDAARLFQAVRIEVNQEMQALREMLDAATELLKEGGRLVVITYHSLEDRMVKNLMKSGNVNGIQEQDFFGRVNTVFGKLAKVQTAGIEEQTINPRSRSAKLRIAVKR
ncbi:MAG: 16S rRNA (cytosine(1402)-N(4))-methyltransferase RsmH [Prevotella sp.]|nr:16S rRNA (cytosine(1402)-N(4))-methyltransferase RsmH [Candidatus Equicola faecalis]